MPGRLRRVVVGEDHRERDAARGGRELARRRHVGGRRKDDAAGDEVAREDEDDSGDKVAADHGDAERPVCLRSRIHSGNVDPALIDAISRRAARD